ncbi:hypothetical protein [Spongiactinospora rosea]|nr:hypothetical protein [Spongiactinospora rosea]
MTAPIASGRTAGAYAIGGEAVIYSCDAAADPADLVLTRAGLTS